MENTQQDPPEYVIIVFDPARKGEKLSLGEQVQQVFGLFTENETMPWIKQFQKKHPEINWQFLVLDLTSPKEM